MELAKGHFELREEENNQSFYEIKLFSTAIPDNISKKSKPLIPQNNAFLKGDRLKKIENETFIGTLYISFKFLPMQQIKVPKGENIFKEVNNKTPMEQNMNKTQISSYLFLFIEKIANVKHKLNKFL